jgi:hypothetical protein
VIGLPELLLVCPHGGGNFRDRRQHPPRVLPSTIERIDLGICAEAAS